MEFRIADTFTESLARLTGEEQKAVKTTAFDLQMDPSRPGMQFHKLERAKDRNFWSVRVNSDVRLIVHRTDASLLLCYVGHHDKAYAWAERRKLETHPRTGAAQWVEIRESVKEIVVPSYVEAPREQAVRPAVPSAKLFARMSDDELLELGVPAEWIPDVKQADEDSLLVLADHLPAEAAEGLLEIATGGRPRQRTPVYAEPAPAGVAPQPAVGFGHPDAQRRFRTITNVEELARALEFPWDRWTVFLHPEQRKWVERDLAGSARVAGSAGTGKTIVAIHRAAHLARANPEARVLLTTFSDPLASALHTRLKRLLFREPRLGERIDVCSLRAIGLRLHKSLIGDAHMAAPALVRELLGTAAKATGSSKFSPHFLWTEWEQVVDARQLATWEEYRDVPRLGRKIRLSEPARKELWAVFDRVRNDLRQRKLITEPGMFTAVATALAAARRVLFDHVVVDEAQDLSIAHLRFLAALGGQRPNGLFFAGDLGQRIFQQPFSWKSLGVDVRGRSWTLRVNYRTSHQIRAQADRLLGQELTDVDGVTEERGGTVSVFNGPPPTVHVAADPESEAKFAGRWIAERVAEGMQAHEVGVFVRSDAQLARAQDAVRRAGLVARLLDESGDTVTGQVAVGTMHMAKGLEFRVVAVIACDDEVLPLQERIENVGDDTDLKDVYDTERQLLYVACTRARDHLLVAGVEPATEFLGDLRGSGGR